MCLQCYFKEQRKENESGVELCQAVPPAVTRSADQQKINLSADCSEDHAQMLLQLIARSPITEFI